MTIDLLKKWKVSSGDVFLLLKSGQNLRLLSAGSLVEEEFLKKYEKRGKDLVLDSTTNQINVEKISEIFFHLKDEKIFDKILEIRTEILFYFSDHYLKQKDSSLLDWVCAFEKVFSKFSSHDLKKLNSYSLNNFRRGQIFSALAVIMALICGYHQFEVLQDLYHLCFLLDVGLVQNGGSYNLEKAIDKNANNENGLYFLQKISQEEYELFLKHISLSLEIIKNDFLTLFNNKNFMMFGDGHHENSIGNGFPRKMFEYELNDLESILMIIESTLEITKNEFKKGDFQEIWKKTLNKNEFKKIKIVKFIMKQLEEQKLIQGHKTGTD